MFNKNTDMSQDGHNSLRNAREIHFVNKLRPLLVVSVSMCVGVCVCVCVCMHTCSVVSDCVQPNGLYLPGSFVYGIFQARILEFIAIFYLRDLPDPGFESRYLSSPALTGRFFTTNAT